VNINETVEEELEEVGKLSDSTTDSESKDEKDLGQKGSVNINETVEEEVEEVGKLCDSITDSENDDETDLDEKRESVNINEPVGGEEVGKLIDSTTDLDNDDETDLGQNKESVNINEAVGEEEVGKLSDSENDDETEEQEQKTLKRTARTTVGVPPKGFADHVGDVREPAAMQKEMYGDRGQEWKEAADGEYGSLIENKTWKPGGRICVNDHCIARGYMDAQITPVSWREC
jgi:hypothetical protein